MFKRLRFAEFVIISFALHGLTLGIMALPKIQPKNSEITVEILDQTPALPLPAVRPAEVQKKKDKTEQRLKQIVEQEVKKTDEEAPDTRFLSAQNQKVEKETVAKNKAATDLPTIWLIILFPKLALFQKLAPINKTASKLSTINMVNKSRVNKLNRVCLVKKNS